MFGTIRRHNTTSITTNSKPKKKSDKKTKQNKNKNKNDPVGIIQEVLSFLCEIKRSPFYMASELKNF